MADGADAAAAAAVDPLAPPKAVPVPKDEYTTYADDAALGKPAPSLDTLEYVQGEPVKLGDGKITVLLFWAKFAKGDYTTVRLLLEHPCSTFRLTRPIPWRRLQASRDSRKLSKRSTPCSLSGCQWTQTKGMRRASSRKLAPRCRRSTSTSLRCDSGGCPGNMRYCHRLRTVLTLRNELQVPYPLAWDAGKAVKEEFRKLSGLMSLGVSATYIIGPSGEVAWREQFGQGYFPPDKGQLAEQLRRLVLKEELLSNGPKPKADEEEEEEEEMAVPDDGSDDDLGLGW